MQKSAKHQIYQTILTLRETHSDLRPNVFCFDSQFHLKAFHVYFWVLQAKTIHRATSDWRLSPSHCLPAIMNGAGQSSQRQRRRWRRRRVAPPQRQQKQKRHICLLTAIISRLQPLRVNAAKSHSKSFVCVCLPRHTCKNIVALFGV